MRLLHTATLEVEEFYDVDCTPPYAILSHTWSPEELTLRDITKIALSSRQERPRERHAARAPLQAIGNVPFSPTPWLPPLGSISKCFADALFSSGVDYEEEELDPQLAFPAPQPHPSSGRQDLQRSNARVSKRPAEGWTTSGSTHCCI